MTVGQSLAAARAEAGLSIEQVSERTRIRAAIISAMERDDFGSCGGDFYARAHLRDIARTIGADPAALVAEYDAEHEVDTGPSAAQVFEPERRSYVAHRGINWSAMMAVAIAAVLAFGLYQVVRNSGGGGTPVAENTSPTATVSAPAILPPTSSATTPPPYVAQAPRGVTVVLKTNPGQTSWISATGAKGKVLFEGLLKNGQTKTLTDPTQLKFTIGNAGAVLLTVNGRDIGAPGGPGQVAHLTFGPNDPAAG